MPKEKVTLSVDDQIIRQAKHHALDVKTTMSALVEDGLQRVFGASRQELRTIAQLALRAWHHFPDATPFIVLAILAFRDRGFDVDPQKTGLRLRTHGRRYVLAHRRVDGQQLIRIHPWGEPAMIVAEVNVTELAMRVRRLRSASDYGEIVKTVWRTAAQVSRHAERRVRSQSDGKDADA